MKIISQRLDVWNPDTGVATQDRSTRVPQQPQSQQTSQPQIKQLPDGNWMLIKDVPGKLNTKLKQIWDKTKKNLLKQYEVNVSPVMAKNNYRNMIEKRAAIRKVADQQFPIKFHTEVAIHNNLVQGQSHQANGFIDWSMDLDAREWGVKDFTIIIPDQMINYSAEIYNESKQDGVEGLFPISIELWPDSTTVTFSRA